MKTSSTPEGESSAEDYPGTIGLPTAPLPDPIGKNIDAIVALQTKSHRDLPQHQRFVEAATGFFGRPMFLYGIMLSTVLWVLPNVLPEQWELMRFDPFPFEWLQFCLGFGSLLMTIAILIKQNRQEQLAEQRAQLGLQMNLLSEQKIAKLIALLEELRVDLPMVQDRLDAEAEVLKQATDPHMVVNILERRLEEELAQLQQQDKSGEQPRGS
ncbi:hypothetical protein AVDCRST_MAG94-1985 [uncultured Leptolyngbya sp.]|uniref:DUF1003 domain-containing protein n=1 Tax=uncultured Leptolyngbya sp. TaxID=332963 RepID=A0A6J4LHY9_9CYAN|nr:hypothetical protein AVDCRST_MAG94-1985 [uncultured Leptolyngbya sp.]